MDARLQVCGRRGGASPRPAFCLPAAWAAVLALAFALLAGLPAAAAEAPADARAAYDAAFREMLADPANLDKTFAYAGAAIAVRDYEGAIGALERMLFINPELPRVRLELGALYFRLGSYEVSRAYLTTALEAPDVPDEVRSRANQLLAEIEKRLSSHQLAGGIYFGLRAQSNATSAPGSAAVRVLGLDATLDDRFTAKGDLNAFAVGNFMHNYRFQSLAGASFETTGLAYIARQQEQRSVDLSLGEITAGPRLPLSIPGLFDEGDVRGYAIGTFVGLGGERYYGGFGAGLEMNALPAARTAVRLTLESRSKHYHNSSARPRNDEQSGTATGVGLRVRQGVGDALVLSGTVAALRNETDFTYNDYTEYAAGLGLDYLYRPGFASAWLPAADPWVTSLTALRVVTGYGGPDPTVDPGTTRQDHDWRFGMITAVPLSQDWTAVLTVGRTQRTSTLPNYKFTNNLVSLGASWRF